MSCARFPAALAIALALAVGPATAQNPTGRKPDQTADLLAKLRKPVDWARADKATLNDLVKQITDNFGVTVLVNESAFKPTDDHAAPVGTKVLKVPVAKGLSLNSALPGLLAQVDATFLVRKDHLEIVPLSFAAEETKNLAPGDDDAPRLAQPLVSMIFKEKPLNDALAELAEDYNLTVVVAPQCGDARTGFVSGRLLNTPADKALELLALQCDLRLVRKGNSFLVTSRDHANDLFNESTERERTKIELIRLRTAPPAAPPQPPQPVQIQVLPLAPINVPAANPPKP